MSQGKNVRISAKAMIIKDGSLLVLENSGDETWYCLPGGGQEFGETLEAALRRECLEEAGAVVTPLKPIFLRDYIASNHEFAEPNKDFHQCEVVFECAIEEGYTPQAGHLSDARQLGVRWLPLAELKGSAFYPKCFIEMILKFSASPWAGAHYLGDLN